jgi:hypothetical protein
MLFVATPLRENKVSSQYIDGLMQTSYALNRHGMSLEYAFELGTQIAINREKLVRRFLKTSCQFLVFIDSDMVFTAKDVLTLLGAEVDIVSGFYRSRIHIPENIPNHSFRDINGKPISSESKTELQECSFIPTGIMMIRRTVFEQLYTKHQFVFDQGFRDTEYFRLLCGDDEDEVMTGFEGEDVHLCRIWREMGGKLFVKTSVRLDHLGEHAYKP